MKSEWLIPIVVFCGGFTFGYTITTILIDMYKAGAF